MADSSRDYAIIGMVSRILVPVATHPGYLQ